jgi:hypothetical protein
MISQMSRSIPTIILGIALWTVALVLAIAVSAVTKIILTCLVGITLGLIGIRYTRRRAKREEN